MASLNNHLISSSASVLSQRLRSIYVELQGETFSKLLGPCTKELFVLTMSGEPPRKSARKGRKRKSPEYTESGWCSVEDYWLWHKDRSKCLEAESRLSQAHAAFFPRDHTHARGFEVVSGYEGGRIQPGSEITLTPAVALALP